MHELEIIILEPNLASRCNKYKFYLLIYCHSLLKCIKNWL